MKKIISCLIVILTIPIFSTFVNAENVEKDYSILKTLEIMTGDPDGNMRWDDKVSRAEFTKVATEISNFRKNIPIHQKSSPFSDVSYKHWASAYIRSAVDNNICLGYPDGTFKPNNNVTYEEALTILLKVLGYADTDFGDSYPSGQYSLAQGIELTENIDAKIGEELTRRQVADLLINVLDTKFKNAIDTPLKNFDITKYENTIILATTKEDVSVNKDKVLTTNGTFKYNMDIDKYVGVKGDIYIKDGDTIIYFIPNKDEDIVEKYIVYSKMSDGVITYKNGLFSQLKIDDSTNTYFKGKSTLFSEIKNSLTIGDVLYVNKNNSDINYINITKGTTEGPYIYSSEQDLKNKIENIEDYLIIKNGNIIKIDELEQYDIYYYIKDLKMLMVYNTKITGIYNSASPNQEVPISINISGKDYEIESSDAFKSLSSTGIYKYGDTITILLGKDKKIAYVMSSENINSDIVGYLIDCGVKNYTSDTDKTVSNYYIKVVTPNGETTEYKAKRDYTSFKNSIVKISFTNELAEINRIKSDFKNISGKFNYEELVLGKNNISKNIEILDVSTLDSNEQGQFVKITPQRIDGINISSSNVLYYELNDKNIITKLIIKEVTNDYYEYGIVQKVEKNDEILAAKYIYNINGSELTTQTQNKIYGVSAGPAKFKIVNNQIDGIQNLSAIKEKIQNITNTTVKTSTSNYLLSDNVKVFYRNYEWDYMLLDLEDVVKENSEYKIQGAFIDKSISSGGRVRIIVVTK